MAGATGHKAAAAEGGGVDVGRCRLLLLLLLLGAVLQVGAAGEVRIAR